MPLNVKQKSPEEVKEVEIEALRRRLGEHVELQFFSAGTL